MKVKITRAIASADWGYAAGQIADLPDEMAENLIKGGGAVRITEKKTVETAEKKPPQTAQKVKKK